MADVNHVIIIGRLTRDAELKYTTAGFPISNLSIAVNRRRKSGDQWVEEVSFFDVNLYGKSAEGLKPYLLKGKQIAVEGELRQDRWEQDGQSRSKVVISANNVQLLGGGQGSGGASTNSQGSSEGYGNDQQTNTQTNNRNNSYQPRYDAGKDQYNPSAFNADSNFPEDIPF